MGKKSSVTSTYPEFRGIEYLAEKQISGCGIFGIMEQSGKRFSGEAVMCGIACMRERGNGLGGGIAAYGIYPELQDFYAFHIIFETEQARRNTEDYIKQNFVLEKGEPIPTRSIPEIKNPPLIWRYFVKPEKDVQRDFPEEDFVVRCVMFINSKIEDAFVVSSGKNMGIFKGVGFPEEIGRFFRLEEYEGYTWTAHNRFPTNTVGWWGGSHPFGILDWSVVHNGEISSYGINKRFLENYGYYCTLFTDTEVMAYLFDLLVRKHKLDFEVVGKIIASPFWVQIDRIEDKTTKEFLRALRIIYGSALVNGPFGVIVANTQYMVGINDRIKLRPLVAAVKGDVLYISSEESAIRLVCRNPDRTWMPKAGVPVVGKMKKTD